MKVFRVSIPPPGPFDDLLCAAVAGVEEGLVALARELGVPRRHELVWMGGRVARFPRSQSGRGFFDVMAERIALDIDAEIVDAAILAGLN